MSTSLLSGRSRVITSVWDERDRQDDKFGPGRDFPDGTSDNQMARAVRRHYQTVCEEDFKAGRGTWRHILEEEFFEALAEEDPIALKAELIQVAAVAVAWVEALDRRG